MKLRCERCGWRPEGEFRVISQRVAPVWDLDGSVPPVVIVRHKRCGELGWRPEEKGNDVRLQRAH